MYIFRLRTKLIYHQLLIGSIVKETNVSLLASVNYGKTIFKNVLLFLFGDSTAPEFYVPTFRNTLSVQFL